MAEIMPETYDRLKDNALTNPQLAQAHLPADRRDRSRGQSYPYNRVHLALRGLG